MMATAKSSIRAFSKIITMILHSREVDVCKDRHRSEKLSKKTVEGCQRKKINPHLGGLTQLAGCTSGFFDLNQMVQALSNASYNMD